MMPRFALLEHSRDGIHWDLMLEREGALRTWAIDAPIAAGAEQPARALPDHRLLYLEYEGEVSGGRGSVRRIDSGSYHALEWGEAAVRVRLEGAQLVGVLELRRGSGTPGETDTSRPWTLRFGLGKLC